MDAQDRVGEFVHAHDLTAPVEHRLLDLTSELGELARAANESTGYGRDPADVALPEDELGDALFSLLALCERADVDAASALETAIEKYEERIEDSGTPASGE